MHYKCFCSVKVGIDGTCLPWFSREVLVMDVRPELSWSNYDLDMGKA